MDIETTKKVGLFSKTLLILLTVVFFLLPFSIGFGTYFHTILGALALLIIVYFNFKDIFKIKNYLIMLIPFIAAIYGITNALSVFNIFYFSSGRSSLFIITTILFGISGFLLARNNRFLLRYIIIGLLAGFFLISIINSVITLVKFGFFYGFRFTDNYSYYDGSRGEYSIASSAYALIGFNIKQVPVNLFLLYPSASLIAVGLYLFSERKNRFYLIFTICSLVSALFAFITVLSRTSLVNIIFLIAVVGILTTFALVPKLLNKITKIVLLSLGGIVVVFMVLFLLNAQTNLVEFRAFNASIPLINYIFNGNRYSLSCSMVLNGFFGIEKFNGFPVFYDPSYEMDIYPSSNFIINEYMGGGMMSLIILVALIGLSIFACTRLFKLNINRNDKYLPMFIFITLFMILFIGSTGNISFYNKDFMALSNVANPIYLIFYMMMYYQLGLATSEVKE